MISPNVKHYLIEHLQGQRSADDIREILRLVDNTRALEFEFDRTLEAVSKKIPGLAIDFQKLLAGDEIECDPLVSQGNLALLRLDAIYHQAFAAWTKSGGDLHRFKRITKAENPATYSDKMEKHERTDQNYPPDAQLLNQVVNITLSAFRIQATITHRREKLANPESAKANSISRDGAQSAFSPQQSNTSDLVDYEDSLDDSLDRLGDIEPVEADAISLIRGINKIGGLKGFDELKLLTSEAPIQVAAPSASPFETANTNGSAFRPESTLDSHNTSEEELVTEDTTSKVSLQPPFFSSSNPSVAHSPSPRETTPLAVNEPRFHKRE